MAIEEIDLYWMKAEDLAKYLPEKGSAKAGANSAEALAEKIITRSVKAVDCPEIEKRMAEAIDAVLSITTRLPESDPMQVAVEEKVFEYGKPDSESPLILTSNSKLTQKILGEIFEKAKVKAYVVPVETGGYTMDNAVVAGVFSPMAVMKALNDSGLSGKVMSRRAIISGLAVDQKNGIERITRWGLDIGPVSGYELPLYLLSRSNC